MYEIKHSDDDLLMLIEWEQGAPIIHHHIYNWKLSTHKKMKQCFDKIIEDLKQRGYNELYSYYDINNKQVEKFVTYYGFTFIKEFDGNKIVVKEF